MNIYASPLRQRKIRSTFDFNSLLSSTSSLRSLSIKSQTSLEGSNTVRQKDSSSETSKTLTEESLNSLNVQTEVDEVVVEDSDENEDEYVRAIRKVVRRVKGRSAKELNAICSGKNCRFESYALILILSLGQSCGPLTCQVCSYGVGASQLFWEKNV